MKKIYFLTITIVLTMAFMNAMGQKWEFIRESDNVKTLKAISFTDSINGWMVRYNDVNNIQRTADQGYTWTEIPIQSTPGEPYLQDVHFFNQLEGLILDGKSLQKTADGGKIWTPVELPVDSTELKIKLVFRNSVSFAKNDKHPSETSGTITPSSPSTLKNFGT